MQVRSVQISDISSLAEFIVRLQRNPAHHIGYVSEKTGDIASNFIEIDGLDEQLWPDVRCEKLARNCKCTLDETRAKRF